MLMTAKLFQKYTLIDIAQFERKQSISLFHLLSAPTFYKIWFESKKLFLSS